MSELDLERIAVALTRIAAAFDQYNILYRKQLELEHPPEKPKRAPEVISTESERQEQFSDVADEQWMRDTERAIGEPSRFQKRFEQTEAARQPPAPRRRRTVAVPEGH